jgi:hypothetical protein
MTMSPAGICGHSRHGGGTVRARSRAAGHRAVPAGRTWRQCRGPQRVGDGRGRPRRTRRSVDMTTAERTADSMPEGQDIDADAVIVGAGFSGSWSPTSPSWTPTTCSAWRGNGSAATSRDARAATSRRPSTASARRRSSCPSTRTYSSRCATARPSRPTSMVRTPGGQRRSRPPRALLGQPRLHAPGRPVSLRAARHRGETLTTA